MMTRPGAFLRGQRVTHERHSPQYQMVSLLSSSMMASSSRDWTIVTIFFGL